jgi:hypothetical protein
MLFGFSTFPEFLQNKTFELFNTALCLWIAVTELDVSIPSMK